MDIPSQLNRALLIALSFSFCWTPTVMAESKQEIVRNGYRSESLLAEGPGQVVYASARPFDPSAAPPGFPPPGIIPLPPPTMPAMELFHFMSTITNAGFDLSEEQLEKLSQAKDSFTDEIAPVSFKIHSLERQLEKALLKPDINAQEIAQIRKELAFEKQILEESVLDQMVSIAKLLTSEQRHKIKLFMDKQELAPMPMRFFFRSGGLP